MLLGPNGEYAHAQTPSQCFSRVSQLNKHQTTVTLSTGCGKSTLLRVLGGLLSPDSGKVVCDQPSGFVFQNPDHQVVMPTVAADVAFGLGR